MLQGDTIASKNQLCSTDLGLILTFINQYHFSWWYLPPAHPHPKSCFIFSCLARQGSALYRRLSLRCSDTIEIVALAPSQLSTITKQIQKTHTQRQVQKTNTNKKELRSAERLLWHNLTKELVASVVHLKSAKSRTKRNNTNKKPPCSLRSLWGLINLRHELCSDIIILDCCHD